MLQYIKSTSLYTARQTNKIVKSSQDTATKRQTSKVQQTLHTDTLYTVVPLLN